MRCTCRLRWRFKQVARMIKLLWIEARLFYWQAALHQMGAAHADAPLAVMRIRELLEAQSAWRAA
jgi:hypothetical protein